MALVTGTALLMILAALGLGGGTLLKHRRGMRELDLQEKMADIQKTAGVRTGQATERMTSENRRAAMQMRTEDRAEGRAERRETRQQMGADRETQLLTELIRMAMMPSAGNNSGGQAPPSLTALLGRS